MAHRPYAYPLRIPEHVRSDKARQRWRLSSLGSACDNPQSNSRWSLEELREGRVYNHLGTPFAWGDTGDVGSYSRFPHSFGARRWLCGFPPNTRIYGKDRT